MNATTHSAIQPSLPLMLRRLVLAIDACLILGLASCSLMPVASVSPLPPDLHVGMSQFEVKHRLGLPDQVRMLTQENPVSTITPYTAGTRPTIREAGEIWLYRDYGCNTQREG
ncbi:MAG TPA: hypothetical protein VLE43_02290, partial [Candidatus Saccharimonadia bacterium]|nr:hypothetical protein [Candidatus Saccharimonadia bacterium]